MAGSRVLDNVELVAIADHARLRRGRGHDAVAGGRDGRDWPCRGTASNAYPPLFNVDSSRTRLKSITLECGRTHQRNNGTLETCHCNLPRQLISAMIQGFTTSNTQPPGEGAHQI